MTYGEMIREAPIVVVGLITSVESTGVKSKQVQWEEKPTSLLWLRVNLKVENVLRGSINGGDITYYYFEWGGWPTSFLNKEHPVPGMRCVLFLQRDVGVLRSIIDLYQSHIKLMTGKHRGIDVGPERSVAKTIVRLALTPGEDFAPEAFSALQATMSWQDGINEPIEAAALLTKLLSFPDPRVRDRACLELVDGFRVNENCLREITDSDVRILAEQSRDRVLKTQASTRHELEASTLVDLQRSLSVRDTDDVWRQLVILLLSSDQNIRERSCSLLREYFPARRNPKPFAEHCPQDH
jgi:hypothetical protein